MKINLDTTKSLEKNAAVFFEKSKKAKRKLEGAKEALEKSRAKLNKAKEEKKLKEKKAFEEGEKKKRKKAWYEKFRWFFSSKGFLCIGGRDATTNEIIIKKHTDKDDVVFHTEMSGSPFFVIKTEGKKPGEDTLKQAAQATASYSRAWKAGIAAAEVFYVNPEQVTKEAQAGEYISRGAFMIYGKKNRMTAELKVAIGVDKEGNIIGGPVDAVKSNSAKHVVVVQGNEKTSDTAKKVRKKLGAGDLDEIIRVLPVGGCSLG